MATAPMSADRSRMSFAKVAASAGKDNVALSSFAKATPTAPVRDVRKENIGHMGQKDAEHSSAQPVEMRGKGKAISQVVSPSSEDSISETQAGTLQESGVSEASLVRAVNAMNINVPMPSLVVNGSGTTDIGNKIESSEGFLEDPFQRVDSGSELGTKPPSLDGKSITSGTTFALDEKESLRPDDSASVKAAEDDDTFSGRGSIVAGSRIGSEAAGRAYRAQFYEAQDRRNMHPMQERQAQGIVTPQSGSSGQHVVDNPKPAPLVGDSVGDGAFNLFYRQTPDEKLLEALESPKDRIFLLRLEQDVIEFVKDSKEPFIDLPPCNSFCRMLTHKLADYYHMTHQVDAVAGAVRIFRTPFCRLPPSLTSISNPPTSGSTPPPSMPAMKIMRRGGEGDTGPSPSKATSETGSDGKDKSLSAKEKLSREEREAAYNKARERIFGKDEKSGDATPDTEDGNEMSRSSSISTKDKSGQSKKAKPVKQRRDDSEGFDVRSQYAPFFPQQQNPTWGPTPQFSPMMQPQFSGVMQTGYPQQYGQPAPQFNQVMMNTGNMPAYNNAPQYGSPSQPRYQQNGASIATYMPSVPSPPVAAQQWQQQNMYQASFPQQPRGRTNGPQNSVPYLYGQLPGAANPADPKSQHPIPGSFNRHAFNPKTQSFVPGNNSAPIPQALSHHGSPRLSYNAYTPPQQQYGNGMGYSMARQDSNNSIPSYHASPHMGHRPMMHQTMPQGLPQGMPPNMSYGIPQNLPHGLPQGPQQGIPQNAQSSSHLPNYNPNPATLPPKPPTGV